MQPKKLADSLQRAAECVLGALSISIVIVLVFSSAYQLGIGTDDLNLIATTSSDETLALKLLLKNIANHDLDPRGFYAYGYLHPTISYGLLSIFRQLGYDITSTRLLAFTTRGVSWLAYGLLLLLFERTLRPLKLGFAARWQFVAFLGSVIVMYRWGHSTHPDMLAVLLAVCVLWTLLQGLSLPFVMLAAVFAGLAFGSKANGLFSLGIPLTAYASERLAFRRTGTLQKEWQSVFAASLGAALCFVVGWIGSNPYVPGNFASFLIDFAKSRRDLAYGPGFKEVWSATTWVERLGRQFPYGGAILLVIGIALLAYLAVRHRNWRAVEDAESRSAKAGIDLSRPSLLFAVAVYVVLTLGQLTFQVRIQQDRYMLHIVPFVIWLAAAGYASALENRPRILALLLPLAFAAPTVWMAGASIASRHDRADVYNSEIVKAGLWISAQYPPTTRILAERYSYVPSDSFTTVLEVKGINENAIRRHKPDLLILNATQSSRYSWKKPGTRFEELNLVKGKNDGADAFLTFHQKLFAPDSAWKIVYEREDVVVLDRKPPPVAPPAPPVVPPATP